MGLRKPRSPDTVFWNGKRVLLTGHTGLKGSWTALWLSAMGANVMGFALVPDTDPSLFALAGVARDLDSIVGDLRDEAAIRAAVVKADPQIVIHMAAQPLVRRSLLYPIETFATNVLGTANLLNVLRDRKALQSVLVITSDKVYANDSSGRPFMESDQLGGKDPYAASKAAAELVTRSFAASYFDKLGVPVATARAGNIIGGGDFAEDRLIPDLVRAVRLGKRLVLRHPEATRPWQHVLDCVAGYLLFVEALTGDASLPRALNFGPSSDNQQISVSKLAETMFAALENKSVWEHVPVPNSIEMTALAIDSTKSRKLLGWQDRLGGEKGVVWTADWYNSFFHGADVRALTLAQISAYQNLDRKSVV